MADRTAAEYEAEIAALAAKLAGVEHVEHAETTSLRKHPATLLFADLRGFRSMAEKQMPEVLHALIDSHLETMFECIDVFDGTVESFAGDGLLAVFGAPRTASNHALRALVCAAEMQRRHANWMSGRRKEELPAPGLGIGIDTGIVVAGHIGPPHQKRYAALGPATNLCARLCSAAEHGQIFITPDVHTMAASRLKTWSGAIEVPPMRFESQGPHRFKHVGMPVQVIAVTVRY